VLHSDWAAGEVESARTLGAITVDTRSGTAALLPVELDGGSAWQGFTGVVRLITNRHLCRPPVPVVGEGFGRTAAASGEEDAGSGERRSGCADRPMRSLGVVSNLASPHGRARPRP
jgi:hypothetical protein